jgi:hypothetical protein
MEALIGMQELMDYLIWFVLIKKYSTRVDFKRRSRTAYSASLYHGIHECVCAHMVSGVTGFDKSKPGSLYYIKIDCFDDVVLYKIGITNNSISERISSMMLYRGVCATIINVIEFCNGIEAYNTERNLLRKFKEFRYRGKKVMKSGNTELFTKNVLCL